MDPSDALRNARAIVLDAAGPAFLIDEHGLIRAWNTAAGCFFGLPAWRASARPCFQVLQCHAPALVCPLLEGGRAPEQRVSFGISGVPAASLRHTAVLDAGGELRGVIHELAETT